MLKREEGVDPLFFAENAIPAAYRLVILILPSVVGRDIILREPGDVRIRVHAKDPLSDGADTALRQHIAGKGIADESAGASSGDVDFIHADVAGEWIVDVPLVLGEV